MKKLNLNRLKQYLPFVLMLVALLGSTMAIADVGNQNRYSSGGGGGFDGGGDGDILGIALYLLGLFIDNPVLGLIILIILVVFVIIRRKKIFIE